jgi:DNA-binding transcriptional ArsR family regulator
MDYFNVNMSDAVTMEKIFAILADRHSANILDKAYSGFKASSMSYSGSLSKKQFYVRLKRLRDAGLVEKRDAFYRTTTFGSLVYNSHVKTMGNIIENYWNLKAIDVLKAREDFPPHQKETLIGEILQSSNLKEVVNSTHLSGFAIVKDFNGLVNEVIKILENAQREIYFATRYHDPHISSRIFDRFTDGVKLNLLDGNPEQISLENRLNAILRTPPNKETFDKVNEMIRSPHFNLMRKEVPISFVVVDGRQVVYETTSYSSPEQFTVAISNYDDPYMAQRFIGYFNLLSKDATIPHLLASVRER